MKTGKMAELETFLERPETALRGARTLTYYTDGDGNLHMVYWFKWEWRDTIVP